METAFVCHELTSGQLKLLIEDKFGIKVESQIIKMFNVVLKDEESVKLKGFEYGNLNSGDFYEIDAGWNIFKIKLETLQVPD